MKIGRRHPAGGGGVDAVRWVMRDGETESLAIRLFSHFCATEHCHVEGEAVSWEDEIVEVFCRPYLPLALLLRINV